MTIGNGVGLDYRPVVVALMCNDERTNAEDKEERAKEIIDPPEEEREDYNRESKRK